MPKVKTAKPKAPKPTLGKDVLVNVILDRSGSMMGTAHGTISGYNEYLNGLKADKATNYSISLIQFDSPADGPELTVSYVDKPLAEVPELIGTTYQPRGMTPLYDAVGECVRRVDAKGRLVITVIITDGCENASKEFSQSDVQALIKEKEQNGWSFVFLAANIDAKSVGASMGMSSANTFNYSQGHEKTMYSNLAYATGTRSERVRSSGLRAASAMCFMTKEQEAAQMGGVSGTVTTTTTTTGPMPNNPYIQPTGGPQAGPSTFPSSPADPPTKPTITWKEVSQSGSGS